MNFNSTQALQEGWDLFEVDGRWQLQRIDDPEGNELGYDKPKFESDADAIIFVALQAHGGSSYHRTAIEYIGTLDDPTASTLDERLRAIGMEVISTGGGCEAWHLAIGEHHVLLTDHGGTVARGLSQGDPLYLGFYETDAPDQTPVAHTEGKWAAVSPALAAFKQKGTIPPAAN